MARYTDPKCRLCRREGVKLFLKGSRCDGPMCAITRRQTPPGQHGKKRTRKPSDYGLQLREKQKVKRLYGVLEAQFKRYYARALRSRGNTGEALLQILESRLDNTAYRLGWGLSKSHSRQVIGQGKVLVNNKVVRTPSYQVKKGEQLKYQGLPHSIRKVEVPKWLSQKKKGDLQAKVVRLPERDDVAENIDEQMIVEFYSR